MAGDILVIAVNYNTNSETIRCVKSIASQSYPAVQVIIVDNSDEKFDPALENELYGVRKDLQYLKSPSNLGYFGGADLGKNEFLKTHPLPDWIIVCNVDIIFNEPDFFRKLSDMPITPNTGVIAPSIISRKWKTDANPKIKERYTKEKMKFYSAIYKSTVTHNLFLALSYLKKMTTRLKRTALGKNKTVVRTEAQKIYAPHGSCIIFNRNYFERGGTLRHISFLFGEEIFVAETCAALRLDVLYVPELRILDFEHASTGFFYSRKMAELMKKSTEDIINTYYK